MLAITETWLHSLDDVIAGNICPPGYHVLHVPQEKGLGGGVGCVIHNNLKSKLQTQSSNKTCEHMELLVSAACD